MLSYPFHDQIPAHGTTIEVAPGVHWLQMPLPFQLNHINLWLLEDGAGWTAIDAGYASAASRQHWETLFATTLQGKPISRLILTHYHPDHVGNASWLCERFRMLAWMTETEYLAAHSALACIGGFDMIQLADDYARHGLPADEVTAMKARGNNYRAGVPSFPNRYRRMLHGDVIRIGADDWQVIVGHGHAPEHASLYCATRGILISGDMLLPKISSNVGVWASEPDGDPLRLFLESLDRFDPLPSDTLVLPSHGKVFRGIQTRTEQLRAHHAERLGVLVQACQGGPRHAHELVPVLFGRALDTGQLFFGMAECIAHLNCLWHRGQLTRLDGSDGVRFLAC